MITLPDFNKPFDYENNFYLSCDNTRISKMLAHYELFKMAQNLPGAIVECGILKGCSLVRFATFRDLFCHGFSKKIIGFDSFGEFPETNFEADKLLRERHVQVCGQESISVEQLQTVLKHKGISENVELVEGDITKTVPAYVKNNPQLRISLLNLDVDIYEPSKVILENLYSRIIPGGICILDDYGLFPGETQAVDEYFKDKKVKIQKLPFSMSPCYVIKE